ncbi:MAG: NAD(P)H-dependent oxidoreductase [Candidatus Kaiserbacteria bacterium]|nr:NAD(P)H-dependent oxidoreductase [Candidatus Kaiserbacteria bacterium]
MNILMMYGSLREKSTNKALANAVAGLAPETMKIETVGLHELPFYNQDLESSFPESAKALKEKIRSADGIIIVTPEYNRSIPGVLKNMLDWTSRPYGDNAWDGRPVGVLGASVGALGATLAQYHLKQILSYLNTHVMGQPEFHLNATDKFDAEGNLTDESTKEHIKKFLAKFQEHIAMFK